MVAIELFLLLLGLVATIAGAVVRGVVHVLSCASGIVRVLWFRSWSVLGLVVSLVIVRGHLWGRPWGLHACLVCFFCFFPGANYISIVYINFLFLLLALRLCA